MTSNGFEKIANNCDILINIFKYLNFADQLRLAHVSELLKSIFYTYVWRDRYSVMTISEDQFDYTVVGGNGTASLILQQTDFDEFLDVYAGNVLELTVKDFRLLDITDIKRIFPNLKKLEYEHLRISSKHVHELPVLYPTLEEISLRRCTIESYPRIMFGQTLSIKTLSKLKHLRRLTIKNIDNSIIKYHDFRQAVTRLKLESLKLNAIIGLDEEPQKNEKAPKFLQELNVMLYSVILTKSTPTYLINFENLITLNVRFVDPVNECVLQGFVKSCQHLQHFIIKQTYFIGINTFSLPPKVTELHLLNCRDLTTDNLKQILTELSITKFTSIGTHYQGNMEPIQISPLFELLDLDAFSTHKFLSSREKELSNLKELRWYEEHEHRLTANMFSHISLESCPNLEKLFIIQGFIPSASVQQLKLLTYLSISDAMPFISWPLVIALLKHTSLIEFKLSGELYRSILCRCSDLPTEGFSINIKTLEISFAAFQGAFKFWIDLLRRNENLKLICHNFKNFDDFLKSMVNDDDFPRSIRVIDIWGFIISTNHLRRHFDVTLNKFIQDASFLRPRSKNYEDMYRMILCRSNNKND